MGMPGNLSDIDCVNLIYKAGLEPELWPEFLSVLSSKIRAQSSVLSIHHFKKKELNFLKLYERDPKFFQSYSDYFIKVNPYLARIAEKSGGVYLTQEMIPDDQMKKYEFYNDWLRPQNIHYRAGLVVFRDDTRLALADFQRPKKNGEFGEADIKAIQLFEPHIKRAIQLNQRFWDIKSQSSAAITVLDNLEIGVILIDEHKRPVYVNHSAEELAYSGGALVIGTRSVSAGLPDESSALEKLIHEATRTGKGKGLHPGGSLLLGASHEYPLCLLVTPLQTDRNDLGLTGSRVCAAIFVTAPTMPHSVPLDSLQSLFVLTHAEAHLVQGLANGLSLEEISEKSKITINTARSQLKKVFSKTGTRRQAELTKLVLRIPSAVVSENMMPGQIMKKPFERRRKRDRRHVDHVVQTV